MDYDFVHDTNDAPNITFIMDSETMSGVRLMK